MNITIIGGGNLGQSIAKGLLIAAANYRVTITRRNIDMVKLSGFESRLVLAKDNAQSVKDADVIIITVKPHQVNHILNEIAPALSDRNRVLLSAVTGVTISQIGKAIKEKVTVFRIMPNTGIATGESMTCIGYKVATEGQKLLVSDLMQHVGLVTYIDESLMDAATVLGACGIAFALRYIRAVMQGGIEIGFDSKTALMIAAQTVKGAASLILENNSHPEQEIDKVTTPQGCTIAGLNEMEHQGFSPALIKGILTSFEKIDKIKSDANN